MEIIDSPFKSSHLEGSKIACNSKSHVFQPNLKHILCVVKHSSPKSKFDPTLPRIVPGYGLFWDGLFFICHAEADVLNVDYLHTHLIYSNGFFGNFEVFC